MLDKGTSRGGEEEGPARPPAIMVQGACVRRLAESNKYQASDFEILLVNRIVPPYLDHFTLPNVALRKGELPADAAIRSLKSQAWISGHNAVEVDCKVGSHPPKEGRPELNYIALLYYVACAETEIPSDLEGYRARFFPLSQVLNQPKAFPMAFDHRSLLFTMQGWLRQQFVQGVVTKTFSQTEKEPLVTITNPLHEGGHDSGEKPMHSWTNPYFASGVLKPKPLDKVTKADLARFRSRRSETLVLLGQRPVSSLTDQPELSTVTEQQPEVPPLSRSATVHKSTNLSEAPGAGSSFKAITTDAPLSRRSTVATQPTSASRQGSGVRKPSWMTGQADLANAAAEVEEEDDVIATLKAVKSHRGAQHTSTAAPSTHIIVEEEEEEPFSRPDSVDLSAAVNPFADDLAGNTTFTNPLFEG